MTFEEQFNSEALKLLKKREKNFRKKNDGTSKEKNTLS